MGGKDSGPVSAARMNPLISEDCSLLTADDDQDISPM